MQFRIADTFTDSLARLSGDEQKTVSDRRVHKMKPPTRNPRSTSRRPCFGLVLLPTAMSVLLASCAANPRGEFAVHTEPTAHAWMLSDYCWSPSHFFAVDLDRVEFLQIVNDDLVLYQITGAPDAIHCVYPVEHESIKQLARERGIRHSRRIRVTP